MHVRAWKLVVERNVETDELIQIDWSTQNLGQHFENSIKDQMQTFLLMLLEECLFITVSLREPCSDNVSADLVTSVYWACLTQVVIFLWQSVLGHMGAGASRRPYELYVDEMTVSHVGWSMFV